MKKFFILFLMFFVLEKILSQPAITISSSFISDDNIFKLSEKKYSNITSMNINPYYNYFTDNSQLKISYNLNSNLYNNYSVVNNLQNLFEIGYAYNTNEENLFLITGSYNKKTVKDEYDIYDEENILATLLYDFIINENHSGEIRYNFSNIKYKNIPDFSYLEHVLGYTSSFNWETKTTLIFDLNIGYKIYTNDIYSITNSSDTNYFTPKGKGYGSRLKMIISNSSSQSKSNNSNLQVLLTGKIAQSIFNNLGASLSFSIRKNLINNSRVITNNDNFFSDDNLFDDNYGYNENDFEITTTFLPFTDLSIKNSFEYKIKKYENVYPDDKNNLLDRKDNKYLYILKINKSFDIFENILNKINIYIYYVYIYNFSNINIYTYSNNIFGIGMTTTITF